MIRNSRTENFGEIIKKNQRIKDIRKDNVTSDKNDQVFVF